MWSNYVNVIKNWKKKKKYSNQLKEQNVGMPSNTNYNEHFQGYLMKLYFNDGESSKSLRFEVSS